jgi:hypothetical protein
MTDDPVKEADRRLEEALEARGARDPREFYRQRLRDLKEQNPEGYEEAVDHYRNTLIPEVASGEVAPLEAWTRYGRRLAEAAAEGRTVAIDETGRARPWSDPDPPPLDHLILHLPDAQGQRAVLVGLPGELSSAQRATYDVLVSGRQKLRED